MAVAHMGRFNIMRPGRQDHLARGERAGPYGSNGRAATSIKLNGLELKAQTGRRLVDAVRSEVCVTAAHNHHAGLLISLAGQKGGTAALSHSVLHNDSLCVLYVQASVSRTP